MFSFNLARSLTASVATILLAANISTSYGSSFIYDEATRTFSDNPTSKTLKIQNFGQATGEIGAYFIQKKVAYTKRIEEAEKELFDLKVQASSQEKKFLDIIAVS